MKKTYRFFALLLILLTLGLSSGSDVYAQKKRSKGKVTPPVESSSELKKRQKSTQQEIKETRAKIATNEKSVSQGIADLSRIDADIKVTEKQVADLATQVTTLDKRIGTLTSQIRANERELKGMRDNYLVAVKRMRLAKGRKSALSFIFSSKNFTQAMRRIRYLREFDAWRERETRKIKSKNEQLKAQNRQLSTAKKDKNTTLSRQQTAKKTLQSQYARQDALVASLKRQGDELRAHLAKKQSEANELRNSISAAIAAEQQREAERRRAEEQRLAEQRRRVEAQKAEERRIAQQKAEEQKRIEAQRAEQQRAEQQRAEAAKKRSNSTSSSKKTSTDVAQVTTIPPQKSAKAKKRQEPKKVEPKKKKPEEQKRNESSGRSYAEARKRAPRTQNKIETDTKLEGGTTAKSQSSIPGRNSGGGFAGMKGSLPRPVSGAFRVTSPFGRHALPELPGVTYDNPGIDAEVSAGATAQAVYGGRVTGIYRLPGYNTVVIVSHGDYYTVYGNLATTNVKNGDTVKQGQAIGKVANSDDGGRPSIHFEVWKNRDKLNPSEWIR